MTAIDVFYQGEGLREIEHIELDPEKADRSKRVTHTLRSNATVSHLYSFFADKVVVVRSDSQKKKSIELESLGTTRRCSERPIAP